MTNITINLVVLFAFYLFLIKPNINKKRAEKMKSFEKVYLTHRGLFNNLDTPENSIKAFEKTVENGYGTELDVQLTKDNKLVVFHDESLLRMCGVDKKLTECTYDKLQKYNLLNTNEKIPLFKDVLDVLKEDTPLIIEIKPEGDYIKTTDETIKLIKTYKRNYTVESFNPNVVKHLKDNYPEIIRGQLAYNMLKDSKAKENFFIKFALTYLLLNFFTRPDYIAYDINNMNNLSFKLCSKLFKAECVAWTVKSQKDLTKAKKYYKQIIFDSFILF